MKLKDQSKEKKIKKVTIDIVHKQGLAGIKMSAVAKAAKLSPSNLYVYFANKEDLLRSVFLDTALKVGEKIFHIKEEDKPYKIKIYNLYKSVITTKLKNIKETSFMDQFVRSPYFKPEYHEHFNTIAKEAIALLQHGQETLILKDKVDINLLIAVIHGTTDRLVEFHQNKRIQLDDNAIEQSFTIVWDAIRQ